MAKRIVFFIPILATAVWVANAVGFRTVAMVAPAAQTPASTRSYVGSATCGDCHVSIYERWAKTRMANVVTDPKVRPQVVIPDFSKPDPLLTFKLDDVA